MLEYIILGILMYGDKSGYDLKQYIQRIMSNFFDASFGSIYPALKRMEHRGIIVSRETVEGGKFKKFYTISDSGKAEFMNWMEQPVEFSKTKPDHLIKVFFCRFLPKEKVRDHLCALKKEVEPVLHVLEHNGPEVKKQYDIYQFSTLKFGVGYYKYILNWCDDLLRALED
ncbi:hypothetical protein SRRS_51550 [Sporomusa rhizae]|uniref:PadR family transcriptional regulator n=1 Tax=Sporomusa rhizae TaxID=357999 RepID=UPI00352B30E6